MGNYKNLETIKTLDCDNKIALRIKLKQIANFEFENCYQDAIVKLGSHVSLRASGAPTVDNVVFEGQYAITRPFPNNKLALGDAKDFLNEFDSVIGFTYKLYEELQHQKAKEEEIKKQKAEERKKEIDKLDDFFNN
ncbi:MAG: hypothetical protein K6G74_04795 [Bacilli bacterium]|nr:hypothetical protein [Bacilli bacterium]